MQKKIVPVMILIFAFSGCARTEKVRAVEAPASAPYDTLGTLEVQERACRIAPVLTGMTKEAVTLGRADTSRAEMYKNKLKDTLARTAKNRYGANAVVNVTYWPDPASSVFPEGYIHARGEMIRYKKFPAPETEAPAPSAAVLE
ncbi:MAG TPA: hypothetical protein VL688_11810 [Verrucomicrobiae bacterium]|jgi:hypothetical protein|nr:hypothetical protein [Verrucomicrobiae bacterium]